MPKTANEELFDAIVRHQIYLLRYSATVRNKINAMLTRAEEQLEAQMRVGLKFGSSAMTPKAWDKLEALNKKIKNIRLETWDEVWLTLREEMLQLSVAEVENASLVYKTVAPVVLTPVLPDVKLLRSITLARPFEGRILKDWANSMASDDIRRIHSAIQTGMVAGESTDQIVRRVIGTTSLKGSDGATELTRQQVASVTRTAVNHIANHSRDAWFAENADILAEERFVATLDSRTTPICRAMDGKTFALGKGPRPPLHFGCRSLRIAGLDGVLIGDRPAKPTTEKLLVKEFAEKNGIPVVYSRDDLPRGFKTEYDKWSRGRIRQLTGPIPASTTYQDWLKGQSKDFQDEILGATKAKLFRSGGLTLDKFVHRDGDELTLGELARKHADAFKAAGLDPTKY